jgi:hypothetical protein
MGWGLDILGADHALVNPGDDVNAAIWTGSRITAMRKIRSMYLLDL